MVKLCMLHLRCSDIMACLMIWQRNIQVAGNHECKETDGINSVQSSLKSDALWVILNTPREYFFEKTRCYDKEYDDVRL